MALMNDQVIPEIAEDFGDSMQVGSGNLRPNLQATVDADDYRRVLRTSAVTMTSSGAGAVGTITFLNGSRETRRFFLMFVDNQVAAILRIIGTIQRGNSAQLKARVMDAGVGSSFRTFVIGKYDRPGAVSGRTFPDEIIQPPNSTLDFKISNSAGGVLPAGSINFEFSYWREPVLRGWQTGRPDSQVDP